ncbi:MULTISPECIES: VUT family protein [Microbacterium]|uniref:VUT family protein n=1 Tax=Microbacterium TaxID=33882 RepID=UPI00190F14F6|nr:VUT family protein [Microbacterium profundi]
MNARIHERRNLIRGVSALAVYVAAIVAANVLSAYFGLVPVGFGLLVSAGTYAAGFALLSRDFVHTYLGVRGVLVGIAVGVILSWFLATPALAMASAVAFLVAEVADMLVFLWIRPRGFVRAALISNCVSAPIDTILFLWIAGFPLIFESIVGQMVGKVLWATVVPLAIFVGVRAVLRRRARTSDFEAVETATNSTDPVRP